MNRSSRAKWSTSFLKRRSSSTGVFPANKCSVRRSNLMCSACIQRYLRRYPLSCPPHACRSPCSAPVCRGRPSLQDRCRRHLRASGNGLEALPLLPDDPATPQTAAGGIDPSSTPRLCIGKWNWTQSTRPLGDSEEPGRSIRLDEIKNFGVQIAQEYRSLVYS